MSKSTIAWTDETWNPITGCDKISDGCKNCYAATLAKRLKAMGQGKYENGFKLTIHEDWIKRPLQWKKPRLIFVNSMSDLFHKEVPDEIIDRIFEVMRATPQHTYQVLTKRADRLAEIAPRIDWPSNVWMGVTVESNKYIHRIDLLKETGAALKFLSLEPLIGPLPDLDLQGIHWTIVAGESGPNWRPMKEEWVRDILQKCQAVNVPFFFKQWAGFRPKSKDSHLYGQFWKHYPNLHSNEAND